MKTRDILCIVSALALGLAGCSQEHESVKVSSSNTMSFNIMSPYAHTRVADGLFEAEDMVGLYVVDYVDAETAAPLQLSGNRANNEAMMFDGSAWATERPIYWGKGKSDVYAYYPYIDEVVDVEAQPFSVATDQDAEGAYEASDLLWAKAAGVSQADGAVSLQMQHSMSRLVVKIMAGEEYVGSLPADATVHLHSTVADARLSLDNGSVVKDPYAGAKSIKMRNLGVHTFAEGDAVVYEAIVVPQMLETSVPLLEINSKSVSYLLEDMFNFKPGVSYTYTAVLNTSTTAIKVEIGCEVEDWNNIGGGTGGDDSGNEGGEDDGIDLSTYTDLSAEGTANCYLVKAAGNYKFKAVQGNSDYTVGNVKKTEALWESFGTDVAPNVGDLVTAVGYKNGYVYFSTPETFKNGNASIAARNSKDVILWSWHIWCSEEGWNDHVYANNAGTMMDRNLGALSASSGDPLSLGLYYMNGRKDPFLGYYIYNSSNVVSTGVWGGYIPSGGYADAYPMSYFSDASTASKNYFWTSTPNTKGVGDPCPIGYRVPDSAEFWTESMVNVEPANIDNVWGFNWELANGTTAWYPVTGIIGSSGPEDGYQPSTRLVTANKVFIFEYNSYGGDYKVDSPQTFKGMSIRCVKE